MLAHAVPAKQSYPTLDLTLVLRYFVKTGMKFSFYLNSFGNNTATRITIGVPFFHIGSRVRTPLSGSFPQTTMEPDKLLDRHSSRLRLPAFPVQKLRVLRLCLHHSQSWHSTSRFKHPGLWQLVVDLWASHNRFRSHCLVVSFLSGAIHATHVKCVGYT